MTDNPYSTPSSKLAQAPASKPAPHWLLKLFFWLIILIILLIPFMGGVLEWLIYPESQTSNPFSSQSTNLPQWPYAGSNIPPPVPSSLKSFESMSAFTINYYVLGYVLITLVGMFGYLYLKRIGFRWFWKAWLFVCVVMTAFDALLIYEYLHAYGIFSYNSLSGSFTEEIYRIFLLSITVHSGSFIIAIFMCVLIYLYGFRSDYVWESKSHTGS